MKKVLLAAVAVFAAVAVNAAWNQECFYGKCCIDGILNKECVMANKKAGKCPKKICMIKKGQKSCKCMEMAAKRAEPRPVPVAVQPAPRPVAAAEPRLEVGRTVKISGTNFDTNSAEVNPNFERYLRGKAGELRGVTFTKVIIVGFTDNTGEPAYNVDLSQRRAKAVADVFVKDGIPAEKIEHSGKGMADPVADNKTKEGRAENRRVEITVK